MRFAAGDITSSWHPLEKGIMAGCTISVILFVSAMNIILSEAAKECKGPKTKDGVAHPSCRAFMDDITVMTRTEIGTRWILKRLEDLAIWSRLTFKPQKSRSLVLKKGKLHHTIFKMQGETIPTIDEAPIKTLGKWFDKSLGDNNQENRMVSEFQSSLNQIEKTPLPGNLKAWCFQYGIIPRLAWPFSLYDISMSTIVKMERRANRYLRKWFGVPKCFTDICLYSQAAPVPLPISSLVEEYKVNKVRHHLQLRLSKDPVARETRVLETRRRGWQAKQAIETAEARLQHSDIIGLVAEGRKGLGSYGKVPWSKANPQEKKTMIVSEIRKQEEEQRKVRAVGMRSQGAWLNWGGFENQQVKNLLDVDTQSLSFLLKSVTDTLPTNSNLSLWGIENNDGKCKLCGKIGTLRHVLSSCPVALSEGRYLWRHNQVLKLIANEILDFLDKQKEQTKELPTFHAISFVRSGETTARTGNRVKPNRLLDGAPDWRLQSDLENRLVFPPEISSTNLRPDIILTSSSKKKILLVELTVPWEERIEEAHELKRTKYDHLILEAKRKGWDARCFPVEVGCRGFPGRSLSHFWRSIGLPNKTVKSVNKKITSETLRCSRWLWIKRDQSWQR